MRPNIKNYAASRKAKPDDRLLSLAVKRTHSADSTSSQSDYTEEVLDNFWTSQEHHSFCRFLQGGIEKGEEIEDGSVGHYISL